MTVEERLDELEARLNAAEAALTDVAGTFKTYKMRMPAALLLWYSQQKVGVGMPLP